MAASVSFIALLILKMAKCILVKLPDDDEARSRTGTGVSILFPTPKFLAKLVDLKYVTGDTLPSGNSVGDAVYPTEESRLIHIANKDLETGTKYELIEESDLPADVEFKGAWEYTAGAGEGASSDLSLLDQLKYNKITQAYYDANK